MYCHFVVRQTIAVFDAVCLQLEFTENKGNLILNRKIIKMRWNRGRQSNCRHIRVLRHVIIRNNLLQLQQGSAPEYFLELV